MAKLRRNGNGNYEWNVNQAEFKGFTKAKLESMHDDIKEMKKTVSDNKEAIVRIKGIAFGISAVVAVVVSVIAALWR